MGKNIKRIIGTVLAINGIIAFGGGSNLVIKTEVYASSEYGIENLQLNKGASTSNIQLYDDSSYKNPIKFKDDVSTYYAQTNMNAINLKFNSSNGYEIKAFKSDKDTSTPYESGETMVLGSGLNIIYVRTYEKGDFDADDVQSKIAKEYQIYVTRNDGVQEDNDQDKIYLKDISLSVGDISFNKKITSYESAIEVSGNNEITIQAKPEHDGDNVRIDNSTVERADKYKKNVRVKIGMNTYKIEVSNDDGLKRVYTVNVIRGDNIDISSSSSSDDVSALKKEDIKTDDSSESKENASVSDNSASKSFKNQWVEENGVCRYYDASGNYLKNTWFTDVNSGKEYYIYDDGTKAVNWILYNNKWYYMGDDGAKTIGWRKISDKWYYFNNDGTMKTGWFKDNNGAWYYFYNTGVMAQNTVIDGYKLSSDGSME